MPDKNDVNMLVHYTLEIYYVLRFTPLSRDAPVT